jgi:Tol biopolymer transport system component
MRRSPSISIAVITAVVFAAVLVAVPVVAGAAMTIERMSVSTAGTQSFGDSDAPAISASGNFVAFASSASTLVAGDTNRVSDVFVRDEFHGTTERVSVATDSGQGDEPSWAPSISADGRFVAFTSSAAFSADDTNGVSDIYVRDRLLGTTERVSVATDGTQANGSCSRPSISADGNFVAFVSRATNLIAGEVVGSDGRIYVHDRMLHTTERVSVAIGGGVPNNSSDRPSISGDGRYVAFESWASDIVAGDTFGRKDVFVYDRQTDTAERMSVSTGGAEGNGGSSAPSISADGRYVAFTSTANNLVPGDVIGNDDIFVRDRLLERTELVSVSTMGRQSDQGAGVAAISADGRFVAFSSESSNLAANDMNGTVCDVFVRDRVARVTEIVSLGTGGVAGNAGSGLRSAPAISADGQFVAFDSSASNLVAGDTNGGADVYLVDRGFLGDHTAPHTTSNRVAYYATRATIRLTATDNVGGSGVVHTYYTLNGAPEVDSTTVRVTAAGVYRLSFRSSDLAGNFESPHTVTFTVIDPPTAGTPSRPFVSSTSIRHGSTYTFYGYIYRHPSGAYPVTLQFFHYEHGRWVLRKTTTGRVTSILTFSKYARSTSVPYSGRWRVRAGHEVNHAFRYSGYLNFTAS